MDTQTASRPTPLWAKALLIVGGVVAAFGLTVLILALFPNLIPRELRASRYDREQAGITLNVQFKVSDGDMFAWMPGKIRPPAEDTVLEAFTLLWDKDGFREPHLQADHYPIAAFGDSFTEGANVPMPWPDMLAQDLQVPVRNYGYRGYGPLEEAQAAAEFAGKEPRAWLLYGYFSGNDLWEAGRAELNAHRSPLDVLPWLVRRDASNAASQASASSSDHYDFPMPVIIGGNYYDMAFLTWLMWWQVAPPQGFEASRSFQKVVDTMDAMTSAVSSETCKALIFFPTKEQLYYPYIHPGSRQYLRQNAAQVVIDENGLLQQQPTTIAEADEPTFIQHLTDQRDAIAKLVASKESWHFIDLLPVFQQHVDAGELLYYPYDGHWNQAGQTLAAQTIADAMKAIPGCPLTLSQ